MSAARRSGVALVVVAVVVAAAAFGLRQLWNSAQNHLQSNGCDVTTYSVDNNQAAVAATMVSVVITRSLPERAAVLTLAAALQESNLRNLAGGDSDSVGVLQQRPSQGWGTPAQLNDLHYATGKFLDALVKIPNWQTEPLAEVIQAVQISADGTLYAQHEPLAQGLSDALTGVTPAGLNCTFAKPTGSDTATAVSAALIADLPVKSPTVTGNTITVPQASWTTAAWFVAQASDLGITSVSYAGQKWQPKKGWKTDKSASSAQVVAVVGTKS
jgi:hypothetical protein